VKDVSVLIVLFVVLFSLIDEVIRLKESSAECEERLDDERLESNSQ
jgi:hypothetical protein